MPEHEFRNGIDTTRLSQTIDAVKQASGAAQFKLRAHTAWVDGAHGFSIIDCFEAGGEEQCHDYPYVLHCDEPDALLGADYGPGPAETVLHALACCVGGATIYYAAAQGVHIDRLEFEVEGDLDLRGFLGVEDGIRRGFQNIRMHCTISGDAPQSKLRELVETGQKYSPVFDIVSHGVPVTVVMEEEDVQASV